MNKAERLNYERAQFRIAQIRKGNHLALQLGGMGLTSLPPEIGELPRITVLFLTNNRLRELPPEIGNLSNLEQLYLSNNQIEMLPPEIGRLSKLKRLMLTDNLLSSLPENIGQLRQLSELYLLRNRLTRIPREIGQLAGLEELYLWGNQLSALPAEIGDLGRLKILNLVRNDLKSLPPELENLDLNELYLHGNPLLRIPAEILGPSPGSTFHHIERTSTGALAPQRRKKQPTPPKSILSFYFSTRSSPLLEARIVIIGDGGVGKTSLARQLVDSEAAREGEESTRRVVIKPWIVNLRNSRVKINVWDFGGQEPMHAAHPYFFTERTLYLIVVSSRDENVEQRVEYWLKMVARYGDGATAIVVVNKIDQHPMDIDRLGLALRYRFLPSDPSKAFFGTSCTTSSGISILRSSVHAELDRLDQIWDSIPSEFFEVKARIAQMQSSKQDIISFEGWNAVCKEAGIALASRRAQLLDLLRNLGLVISFPSDPKLSHLGVLNPEWVVEAIYPLISSQELASVGGLLTIGDIERILPTDSYPKSVYGWLIDLMKAFDLLFADEEGRLLLPMRLPREAPGWAIREQWSNPESLRVELRYDILPESVISRFIVRKHIKAAFGGSWWRLGIALKEQGCESLIRASPATGKIEISILGPRLKRHAVLHGLRAEFASLTENLGPEQLWVVLSNSHFEKYDELVAFAQQGFTTVPRVVEGNVIELDIGSALDLVGTHAKRESIIGPRMEVYMTGDKKTADRGGVLIDGNAKVGNLNIVWNQCAAEGITLSQLALQLNDLRAEIRRSHDVSEEQRDIVVGKLAAAAEAAKSGDGPKAIESLKGMGKWVAEIATKIGTTVAAKAIEASLNI